MLTRPARLTACIGAVALGLSLHAVAGTPPSVTHLVGQTVVEAGRTRVIAFAALPAPTDRELRVQVGDAELVQVLSPARVLANQRLGFVRVAGLGIGRTTLTVGEAALELDVVAARGGSDRAEPRVTSPGPGALAWGDFTAAVQLLDPAGAIRPEPAEVVLQLSDGTELEPVVATSREEGPTRRFAFRMEAAERGTGPVTLTAIARWPDGTQSLSAPVTIRLLDRHDSRVVRWEGEAKNTRERPQRFAKQGPRAGVDSRCSGDRFAACFGAYRPVCAEVDVPAGGAWYQMMIRAAGSPAYGSLPTIGIHVDDRGQPTTNGQIAAERFHRSAIGVPFFLSAGPHFVSPVFSNDFGAGRRLDKNLYVDTVELMRLDGPPSANGARSAGMRGAMMGMGGAMMMPGAMGGPSGEGSGLPDLAKQGGMAAPGAPVAATPVRGMPEGHVMVSPDALRVAVNRPLDGAPVAGGLVVPATCWWAAPNRIVAPQVTLLLNGEPLQTQQAPDPSFFIDAPQFRQGVNTIQLIARLENGATAVTPVHRVERAGARSRAPRIDRHRFSVHDARWGGRMRRRLRQQGGLAGHRLAGFGADGAEVLELPVTIAGRYRVVVEAQGQHHEGAPQLTVSLHVGKDRTAIGERTPLKTWATDHSLGHVQLPYGEKRLRVHFTNLQRGKGAAQRLAWMRAIRLEPAPATKAPGAPGVTLRYPRTDGHRVWRADALVADVEDDRLVAWGELMLDGAPTGVRTHLGPRTGRLVLPLLSRHWTPGPHTLSVRVVDYEGHVTMSGSREIIVADAAPGVLGPYARAIRLLNRFAYGPEPQELGVLLAIGETRWLDARLATVPGSGHGDDPGARAARGFAGTHFPSGESYYHVSRRAIHTSLLDPNPVRARFRAFVENHFTTWIRKVQGVPKLAEHERFARLGIAPFPELLWASATSPTMLSYLDQTRSFAGRLNENYARELLELHTVGVHGGYSQADVTRLSALITGWGASIDGDGVGGGRLRTMTFRFEPLANDERPQQILGYQFDEAQGAEAYGRVREALELLMAHPSTARFISRKLVEHYVAVPAPDAMVADLAKVFLRTHGDCGALLRAIAAHPTFQRPALPAKLSTPLDFGLRLSRTAHWFNPWSVGEFLDRSGMGMFDRETPDGYPEENEAWADSNALIQRWKLADAARWSLAATVPTPWRYTKGAFTPARCAEIVDAIAVRLTGQPLGPRSQEAAVELMQGLSGNNDQKCQEIAIFIARLPEANLR